MPPHVTRPLALLSLGAVLVLAACDQQQEQAETGDDYGAVSTEEAAPTPAEDVTPEADQVADAPPTDLAPTDSAPIDQVADQMTDAVTEVAETLTTLAVDQLNQMTDGQPAGEAAQNLVDQARDGLSGQADSALDAVTALVGEAASQVEQAAQVVQDEVAARTEVDWQGTYAAEVPFYNMTDQPVSAFSEAGGAGEVVGTVAPGGGGLIETCNATLDWCLIPFGEDGQRGWVAMDAFGGSAN